MCDITNSGNGFWLDSTSREERKNMDFPAGCFANDEMRFLCIFNKFGAIESCRLK